MQNLMQHTKMSKQEQRLKAVLKVVGCLTCQQALRVNKDCPPKVQKNAVVSLMKSRRLFYSKDRKYVMNHPAYKPDAKTSRAVDVLLACMGDIDENQIFASESPAHMGFIKGNKCYEIICEPNKDELLKSIQVINDKYYDTIHLEDRELVNYIIVLNDKSEIDALPEGIVFPYLVAVVSYYDGLNKLEEPKIHLYGESV